jgi:hypothetical protein
MWQAYLDDIVFNFRKHKELAEKAFGQVADQSFFKTPGEKSNSIAVIIKHVAGNLVSRWTDFLTSDGDIRGVTVMPSSSSDLMIPETSWLRPGTKVGPPCSRR